MDFRIENFAEIGTVDSTNFTNFFGEYILESLTWYGFVGSWISRVFSFSILEKNNNKRFQFFTIGVPNQLGQIAIFPWFKSEKYTLFDDSESDCGIHRDY